MKQPWEESHFEEGMVGDVDTARLALRWALGRIRELESIKARLEDAESALLKSQRDALSWQKDPAAKFHIELAEHKRVHADEMKAERERRVKLERQLTEARAERDQAVREEKERHERDHKEQVEHLNTELEKVGRYHAEIAKLNRDLEQSWILTEKHRAELAELKSNQADAMAEVRSKAEAAVRAISEERSKALAELARLKDSELTAQVRDFEGRAQILEELHRKREAELDRREKDILAEGRKQEAETWAKFNELKAEWQGAAAKHLEIQERALQESYRQKEEALHNELKGTERALREQERFLAERAGEHDAVLAQKQAALEERYQTHYREMQAQAGEVEGRVLEQEKRLALERSELERGYRAREAALMEESLRRDRELRLAWERDSDLERSRLQAEHETQLAEMRAAMEAQLKHRQAELEAQVQAAVLHQRQGLSAEAARMRGELEAEAARERTEREAVASKERIELQNQEAELERKAAERDRLAAERERQHAEALEQRLVQARQAMDEELEHERRRLQETAERQLSALREALQREWEDRGRRRVAQAIDAERVQREALEAEIRRKQEELEQRLGALNAEWARKEKVRTESFELEIAEAKRALEIETEARAAADRRRLHEEEQALRAKGRAAEERLRRLEDDLDRRYSGMPGAGPGISVEDLVFGVAHQLRTPLAVMQSLSETSLGKTLMRGEDRKAFEAILRSIATMKRRVEQLVEFSKPIPLKAREVDLGTFIEKTVILIDERCRQQSVSVVMNKPVDLPNLRLDPDQMRNALLHLLFNAIEAMPKGGTLTVGASWDPAEGQATVSIKDTGAGIDPVTMPELMRPFFSAKPGGTGLGLAIAQKIMRGHAGELRLSSAPGQGTEAVCRFRALP